MVVVCYKIAQVFLLIYCPQTSNNRSRNTDTSLYVIEKLREVSEGSKAQIKPNTFNWWGNCNGYGKAGISLSWWTPMQSSPFNPQFCEDLFYCWRNSLYEATGFISIPRQECSLSAVLTYGLNCCWNYKDSRVWLLCVPWVRMKWQLLQPHNGHFLPVRVQTPAEVWHLVLLCEDCIEFSQLALN